MKKFFLVARGQQLVAYTQLNEVNIVENIINRIVEIDKKALEIKNETKKMVEENGKKLNKRLNEIEKKELEKARTAGKKEYERLVRVGKHEIKEIELETKKECEELEENYRIIHKKLEKEIFNEIF